ncbi:cation:proton antiporter domain-containing protein [Tenuifilum sp.]|uniref:cation:proton antiporter domain-containing protein n=1 Tax=Tenuifilum sp. TaxID=2760880 RepID=UPI002BBF17A3|nr:cation:proton antiporter [Tenuifilum sp.]
MENLGFHIPISEPITVFGITLLVIFIVPLVFSKLKLPGIIGLIIAGMILGTSGLNILDKERSIELLGNVGLIYLMFLAGLELEVGSFLKNQRKNITFGLLTFTIPFLFGFAICKYFLGFGYLPSLLIASMFSTQTMIAFPIVSRLRLTKTLPVEISIGGTIITDTLVLLIFVIITSLSANSGLNGFLLLIPKILAFVLFIILLLPRFTHWFLRNLSSDQMAQYVFVLATVFTNSAIARYLGIEPIIGAFLAGIVLNRQIPPSAMLMNRIEFIGNALFIPIFLFYVGMLIDLKAFVSGYESLELSAILISFAIISKWLAAFLTQKIFRLKTLDRQLIFGLSTAHAAATIAIILVGYKIGIVDINVLNATIVVIFASCVVSAMVTERAARSYAVAFPAVKFKPSDTEKVLIPVANPSNIEHLIEFAGYVSERTKKNPITLLRVVKDETEISKVNDLAAKAEEISHSFGVDTEWAVRVDVNISSGIVRAAKEMLASKIIMGWSGKYVSSRRWIFGTILEGVLADVKQPVYICSLKQSIAQISQVHILIPRNAEFDPDFKNYMKSLERIIKKTRQQVTIIVDKIHTENVIAELPPTFSKLKPTVKEIRKWEEGFNHLKSIDSNALGIIISARKGTIAYNSDIQNTLIFTSQIISDKNVVIVYPAIHGTSIIDSRSLLSGTGRVVTEN